MEMLKQLRQSRKMTQQDVAQFLGVDRSTYVKYERGTSDPPTATLVRLADYFSVSVDFLLDHAAAASVPGQAAAVQLNADDAELLRKFHALDDMAQARILNSLDFEYQAATRQERAESSISPA